METVTFRKILMDLSLGVYTVVRLRFDDISVVDDFRNRIELFEFRHLSLDSIKPYNKMLIVYSNQHGKHGGKGADFRHIEYDEFIDEIKRFKKNE